VEHRVRDTAKLPLDATTQRICPKIADDFVVKSADNGPRFRTRRPAGHFP
jgi:hypothetical protein